MSKQVSPGIPTPKTQPGDKQESGESPREDSPLSVEFWLTGGLAL